MIGLVLGTGRSGTTLFLEMLRTHPDTNASEAVEDRQFFKRDSGHEYPENYVTKLTVDWWEVSEVLSAMENRKEIKVIWTMRDPRDIVLSKIRRGQPSSEGGDGSDRLADDATEEGLREDLRKTHDAYQKIREIYPKRIGLFRLEDMLRSPKNELRRICDFLGLYLCLDEMLNGPAVMRDEQKKRRYGNKLDTSQIGLHKRKEEIYDGFFRSYPEERLDKITNSEIVKKMIDFYSYREAR